VKKSTPARAPPPQFFGRCEKCGQYPISEETARKFLTKKLKKKLDQFLKQGAHGAVLKFEDHCPVCQPNQKVIIELVVLRPKIN